MSEAKPARGSPGTQRSFTPLTVTAMILTACLVSASYPYMILKMGIGPGMSIVSALVAFFVFGVVMRQKITANQNNLIQTASTAAASAAFMCVVVAALDMMGYNVSPWVIFFWLTATCGLGVIMAIPMRKQYIEVEKLPFPDGIATAETLQVLEDPTGPGRVKAITLGISGAAAAIFTAVRDVFGFIPSTLGVGSPGRYYLGLELSLMNFGTGMLVGLRVCFWMLVASLFTWGVFGPELVANGMAASTAEIFGMEAVLEAEEFYPVLMKWFMWPATILMVANGLAALAIRWNVVKKSFGSFMAAARSNSSTELPMKALLGIGIPLVAVVCFVQWYGFDVNPLISIIAVVLSFPLMLIAIRAAGETNIGPVSVMGSMMQMIFSVISPGNVAANMMSSGTTGSISAEATDVMFDLKTASLVGSNPRDMTIAQFIGVPIGAAMVALVYPVLVSVYGLEGEGALPAPTAHKWKGFAELMAGDATLPEGVVAAMIIAAIAGIILAVVEKQWPKWAPSAMGIGIAMLLPSMIVISIAVGGLFAFAWKKLHKPSYDTYMIPVAAGLVAGEALMAVIIPILKVTGIIG